MLEVNQMKEQNRKKLIEAAAKLLKNKGHLNDIDLPKSLSNKSRKKIHDYIKGLNIVNHNIVLELKEILDDEGSR